MTAASKSEPMPDAVRTGLQKPTVDRPSARARLERELGRDLATVLVRGLARRLR